jgi:uncharacterized membrane protein YfcA
MTTSGDGSTSSPASSIIGTPGSSQRRRATIAVGIGVAAGLLGGLFGVGGGLIIVPGLIALLGMDRRIAHGTSLAATLPIAIASLITYLAFGNVDWPVAGCLALGSVVGAVAGTSLLRVIPRRPLTLAFVVIILAASLRLFLSDEVSGRSALTVLSAAALVGIGFVTGTVAGLLGVGGGVVMVPAMVVLFSMPPVIAKGTSVAVIVPTALMGTARNSRNSIADLRSAILIGPAGVVSAAIGAAISDRISDSVSNVMFSVLLLVVAVMQLWTLRPSASEAPPAPTVGGGR